MTRSAAERLADVRRLVAAAQRVHGARRQLAAEVARASGLSLPGVELGFASLETSPTDADLRSLVARAADAASVHVVLSANVFVAPLRALAIARAASARVTVRPSSRDPVLTRALVEAARDPAIVVVEERDPAAPNASEVHVYGRAATVLAVRDRAALGTIVRGHGPGMGVVLLSASADPRAAAAAIAVDLVAFDQRGCLSPRVVLVEGGEPAAAALASALHEELAAWTARVPRGDLLPEERAEAARWRETMAFVGRLWAGPEHAVAQAATATAVPPSGRHVLVVGVSGTRAMAEALAPIACFVVMVGTDDPRCAALLPDARVAPLGRMQRPPLDGPVDLRGSVSRPR